MNATASRAIASMVFGVLPPDAPTPRLSNVITCRFPAMPSTARGSQLSRTAPRWCRKITGTPVAGPEFAVDDARPAYLDRFGRCVLEGRHRGHRSLLID